MAPCSGINKNGTACHFKTKRGHRMCGKHASQEQQEQVIVLCGKVKTNGQVCGKTVRGQGNLCPYHARREANRMQVEAVRERRREERRVARRVMDTAARDLWQIHADPDAARAIIADAFTRGEVTQHWFEVLAVAIEEEIVFWAQIHVPAAPPKAKLKGDLHKLAVDTQNVHTGPVAKQTTDALNTLLELDVPKTQKTLVEIDGAWSNKTKKEKKPILNDMDRWYKMASCRNDGDFLYKKALDGLWCRIKGNHELVQRLWEEASESRGMCCEGHLSRLCNVLVGFDDAFLPPVSIGEILQQKIAAIAEKDIRVEHKVGEAWVVFEELAIPMADRMPWLEAF